MFVSTIIVAAGKGERLKADIPKQFLPLAGKPILAHTIEKFQLCDAVNEIIVVTRADSVSLCRDIVADYGFGKVRAILPGGMARQDSVREGLERTAARADVVLVHDGVRPFVSPADIRRVAEEAEAFGGCALGVPVKDTLKLCGGTGKIIKTIDRENLWHMQTPQGFRADCLKAAYNAAESDAAATDDCLVMERAGYPVRVIPGSAFNIKITTAEDLVFADAILNNLEGLT